MPQLFYIVVQRTQNLNAKHSSGSADLRTDDMKLVRIARKLSKLESKVLLRNFLSVEQIQDSGSELRLESFAKVEDLKHNSELPLNASDQDKSRHRH